MRSQSPGIWPPKEILSVIEGVALVVHDAIETTPIRSRATTTSTSQNTLATAAPISLMTPSPMVTSDTSLLTPSTSPSPSPSFPSSTSLTISSSFPSSTPRTILPSFPSSISRTISPSSTGGSSDSAFKKAIASSPSSLTSSPSFPPTISSPALTHSLFTPTLSSDSPSSTQKPGINQNHKRNDLRKILPVALTGGLLILFLLTLAIMFSRRKRKRRRSETPLNDEDERYIKAEKEDEIPESDKTFIQDVVKDVDEGDLCTNPFRSSISGSGLGTESDTMHKDKEYNMASGLSGSPDSRANSTTPTLVPRGRKTPQIEIHVQKHQESYSDDDIRSLSHVALSRQSSSRSIASPAPNSDKIPLYPLRPATPSPFLSKVVKIIPSPPLLRSNSKLNIQEEAIRVQPMDMRSQSSHSQRIVQSGIPSSPSPSMLVFPTIGLKTDQGSDTMGSDFGVRSDHPYASESNDARSFSHGSHSSSRSPCDENHSPLGSLKPMKSAGGMGEGSSGLKEEEKNEIAVRSAIVVHELGSSTPDSLQRVDTGNSDAGDIASKQLFESNSTLAPSLMTTATSFSSSGSTTMTSVQSRNDNEVPNNLQEITHALNEKHIVQGEDEDGMPKGSIARFSPDFSVRTVYAI